MTRRATDSLRNHVAVVIVVVWVALVIVSAVDPGRPVPAGVQALMMLVAGYLFAPTVFGRRDPTKGGEDDG